MSMYAYIIISVTCIFLCECNSASDSSAPTVSGSSATEACYPPLKTPVGGVTYECKANMEEMACDLLSLDPQKNYNPNVFIQIRHVLQKDGSSIVLFLNTTYMLIYHAIR